MGLRQMVEVVEVVEGCVVGEMKRGTEQVRLERKRRLRRVEEDRVVDILAKALVTQPRGLVIDVVIRQPPCHSSTNLSLSATLVIGSSHTS